jgi:hypothetical protein
MIPFLYAQRIINGEDSELLYMPGEKHGKQNLEPSESWWTAFKRGWDMKVKIKRGLPPNYDRLAKHFPMRGGEIFTYGNKIYTPARLSKSLLAHEKIHVKQQLKMGVEAWWDKYILDEEFRFQQELEAHKAEFMMGGNLKVIAERLASPLYGNLTTVRIAMELITNTRRIKNDKETM